MSLLDILRASRGDKMRPLVVDLVAPLIDPNEPTRAATRAELVEINEALGRRFDEIVIECDELQHALDEQRPAPDPAVLGQLLKRAWFRSRAAGQLQWDYDARWAEVAETAIDCVRGLWPLNKPEPMPNGDEFINTYFRPGLISSDGRRAPQTVVGGGEGAGASSSPTGAPAPGDTTTSVGLWPCDTTTSGLCAYCGAVARRPLSNRGWCLACEAADEIDLAEAAEQHLEQLARALGTHDEQFTGMPWEQMKDTWRESYRGSAGAVIAAGWRPPLTDSTEQLR